MDGQTPQLLKFDVCIYRKDGIPYEDFVKWATVEYPPKAVPVMKRHGIVRWTQTITPPHLREPYRHVLKNDLGRPEWTVPDYDLVLSYWLRSPDDMRSLTQDPEWIELEKDAQSRANFSIGHFVVGHEIVHLTGSDNPGGASA
ncbi:hypothetical protein MFIFM68171_03686 [Madurella fahalii]|uniref:EthD domain-containing protein n=1 Tax=Madurella fahalii TaxID=1157608 RepID=A0ABQ0G6T7_9PEZI